MLDPVVLDGFKSTLGSYDSTLAEVKDSLNLDVKKKRIAELD